MDVRILRYDTIDSTNNEAAKQARGGAGEGLCIVADEQSSGKGRQGRMWVSERGSGVFLSIILRPRLEAKYLSLITLAAAVAVYDLLRDRFLIQPDIKWPNDVLVGGKKICGILAEAIETRDGLAVILGVGINIRTPEQENATSITAEATFAAERDEIVELLVEDVARLYKRLAADPAAIVAMWQERSSFAHGMRVKAALPTGDVEGITSGLDENGALRLKLRDGSLTTIHAGDVTQLRPM